MWSYNHFSSFFHLVTGGLVRDVPLCLPHLILVIPPDTGKLLSVATAASFVFALQVSIIAQICSSLYDIVWALLFLYLSKCMSRLLLSTSNSRGDSFDAVPVHHPWHWVVRVIHSLSVWQTSNHISLLRVQFRGYAAGISISLLWLSHAVHGSLIATASDMQLTLIMSTAHI